MKAKSLLLTIPLAVTALTFLSLPAGAECWVTCPPGSAATPGATGTQGATGAPGPAGSPEELTPAKKPQAMAKAAPAQSSATSGPGVYRIGPTDVLDISVFKVPELSQTVQVAETGTINLPLVGEIPAAGKTAQQLERYLTAKLGAKYLQNPQVTVLVKQNNSQRLTIQGAVEKPGVYPIQGKTSLLELVAIAGGFKSSSDSTVLILRNSDGKRIAAKFDVAVIQTGQVENPSLQSGDVVIAGTSAIRAGFNKVLKALPIAGLFAFL